MPVPVAGLPWALPFAALPRLAGRRPTLVDVPPAGVARLSVIIPARNEAATIETVIRSVLATTHPDIELIVVDDRSTDATGELVARLAGEDARLRLVAGAELPPGWFGKPWACHQGAAVASGELLVFTDADTIHQPELLARATMAREAESADLLTLTSRQLCLTFWERLVMPQIWVLLGLRYPPRGINRARHERQVVANGQFILIPAATYHAAGGHAAVAGEVVEDLALAQHFFRRGLRVRMVHGEAFLATRMYRSLAELVEGWSKNIHLGARRSLGPNRALQALAPLGVMAAFLFWLLPFGLLALGIAPAAMRLAILLSVVFWMLMSYGMQVPVGYGLGYPLGAAMALRIALRSALRGSRRIEWRGRTYSGATGVGAA